MTRKVFFLYPYYWPLYKSGGPVQSLFNLAGNFKSACTFYVISLDKDIDGQPPETPLHIKQWNDGPNGERIYCTPAISPRLLLKLLKEVKPDVLFINGLFHWNTSFFGMLWGRLLGYHMVISPRGMLQAWALNRGRFKKTIYLSVLKLLIGKKGQWHATDELEKSDIHKIFGRYQQVYVASNIPRALGKNTPVSFPDQQGKVKLVFLSLINPNKNLHLIIDEVNAQSDFFSLDIYGPVIDRDYWELCKSKINTKSSIVYKGAVPPWVVPSILKDYHFFVLPTEGENFGHAIFDALSSGVPVIITRTTPWKEVDKFPAGFYVDLEESHCLRAIFERARSLRSEEYQAIRQGSFSYAVDYLSRRNFLKEYRFLIER